jgi:hypothetical protein
MRVRVLGFSVWISRGSLKRTGEIMGEWVRRILTEVSERYSRRPRAEVRGGRYRGDGGLFRALTEDDFSKMDRFIEKITVMPSMSASLSRRSRAFELYRTVLMPILLAELDVSLPARRA